MPIKDAIRTGGPAAVVEERMRNKKRKVCIGWISEREPAARRAKDRKPEEVAPSPLGSGAGRPL